MRNILHHTLLSKYATVYATVYAGQAKATANEGSCVCLDGENLVGSHKDPVFVAYSY